MALVWLSFGRVGGLELGELGMLMGTEREEGVDGDGRFCDGREELLDVMSSGGRGPFF
jgi:hypothetical protein